MSIQRGEWRVVGRQPGRDELLLRPLSDDIDLGRTRRGSIRVSVTQYGGELEQLIGDLERGNRVEATVYLGRPGRFVDVRVLDPMELVLVPPSAKLPNFVLGLWKRAADNAPHDGPIASSMPLFAKGTFGEVHVIQSTYKSRNLWAEFIAGELGERQFTSFTHHDGVPAEVVAAKPSGRSFFYVVKFGSAGSPAAKELTDGLMRDASAGIAAKLTAQYPNLTFEIEG